MNPTFFTPRTLVFLVLALFAMIVSCPGISSAEDNSGVLSGLDSEGSKLPAAIEAEKSELKTDLDQIGQGFKALGKSMVDLAQLATLSTADWFRKMHDRFMVMVDTLKKKFNAKLVEIKEKIAKRKADPPVIPKDAADRLEIALLYKKHLGREPDKGGLDHYAALVKSGKMTLAQVEKEILASAEYKAKHPAKPADPKPAEPKAEDAFVNGTGGQGLNVRSGPWGGIIGLLKEGASIKILGKEGDWYKIEYNGKTAFVHSSYVKKGSAPKPADKPADPKPSGGGSYTAKGAPGADKAVHWAAVTSINTKNPNNGQTGPKAWSGWCLGHVNRSWSIGAGKAIPQLQKCCAKQSFYAFRNSGKLKAVPKSGPIPAGSPVFWDGVGDYGHKTYGHITIATGRVDANGVPTVIDTAGGIKEVPITRFGPPDGWGVIDGTPLT